MGEDPEPSEGVSRDDRTPSAGWPEGVPTHHDPEKWFRAHFEEAAGEVVRFFVEEGIELTGRRIADIGCGDGVIDLGVYLKANPEFLVGYDPIPVDVDELQSLAAKRAGVSMPDEGSLAFVESTTDEIPAPADSFDIVFSWSAFEHVSEPTAMFREIRRVMRPLGIFQLQIWPLFPSLHGGHLWLSIKRPFAHLDTPAHDIERELDGRLGTDPRRPAIEEFRSLNRMTLDDIQRTMLAAGLRPTKVRPIAETFHLPESVSHLTLSHLAMSGVQMLAVAA